MTLTLVVAAICAGLAAGLLAGMYGVGGGVVFVPMLLALGLTQLEAESTSLLAILPTAAAGAWRQRGYGNLNVRTAAIVGVSSIPGVAAGVAIATWLPEEALQRLFALLLLGVAAQLVWRSRRESAML